MKITSVLTMSSRGGLPPNISVPVLHEVLSSSPSSSPSITSPSCSIDESYKYIFLPICYSFTFIFSILLNSVVLFRSFRQTKRWNASLIYMVNLASTDFMYGLSLPFLVASYIMRDRWIFGDFMCRLVRFLFYFNLYCSIFFLTCISVHRYLGICHPMKVITLETKKAVKCTCVLVWIVVFALTCPIFRFAQTGHVTRSGGPGTNASSTGNPSHEISLINGNASHGNLGGVTEEYQNCWDDAIDKEFPDYVPYGIILHLLGFFVPFSIIAWCYSHVVLTIFRTLHSRPSSRRGPREGGHEGVDRTRTSPVIVGRERRGSNGLSRPVRRDEGISIFLGAHSPYANRRRKSIKTIITITLLFALCFFPFHVTRTIFLLLKVTNRVPCHTMTMVSMCYKITRPLASFNAWLNALLYFLTKDKGGAHCCQIVNSNTRQHAGLLLPLRMMGKGEDPEEGGMDDGIDNKENKAFHNSPSYMKRAKVRYIVE
ncbi:P2Y purinoceptor 3-like [Seriola lalandi dorsalis]|uniref:P2Y purinoceptor 3-like n=1 Tax=Seriola lalandi dorsalis TaxID=1841481 RepID=UPI000C6F9A28|nr:P2Y purinoceptor 3-like [Seriola lalandi dorsalis]XP_056225596.1 P2Y purinoceptor 3 [Seriola aureovittata]XP_056225597.1 P2Y purinoceptor 3 [Seriola aureovittata]XP_056225598.1 P2Y purinoceptor 3 [Seriola aureovittata]